MNLVGDSSSADRFNPRPLTSDVGRGFGVRYPSPFFDIAQQYLPNNQHELHKWCRYYFLTNPIINAACSKMAEYPVTPLIYETADEEVRRLYEEVEDHLKLRAFQVEVGLDYFVYGNAFVSLFFPFEKYLVCTRCRARYRAATNRFRYKWRDGRFYLHNCTCGAEGYADQHDVYMRSFRQIRIVRWNPENIDIKYNEITGKCKYYFRLPKSVINDVKLGQCDEVESLPLEFLEAARLGKSLRFSEDNLYHLKRPTIAQQDQGWGTPLIMPLLKDAFYLQVMKKANEAILMENIVPLRMIFPGQSTGGNDNPYGAYNLTNWKRRVDDEINMWKRDHNYIPVLPVNIGFQQIGGQGRALLMFQEMRLLAEQMLAGAGIPVEFIFGGLQWSGSSTSLRALENMFLGYNKQRHELVNVFIMGKIAAFMQWPKIRSRFDKFRMADDLQRSMFYLQLNQAQKISDHRLMEEIGEDFDKETKLMGEEIKKQLLSNRRMTVATADIQGEAQLRTSRYQAKSQEIMMRAQAATQMDLQQAQVDPATGAPPGQPPAGQPSPDQPAQMNMPTAMAGVSSPIQAGAGGVDLRVIAQQAASYLKTLKAEQGPEAMYQQLQSLQTSNNELYKLVIQLMNDSGSQVNPMDGLKNPAPAGTPQADPGRQIG